MTTNKVQPEYIRREQIIKATLEVIYLYGLNDTTMAKIAKEAGLSVGILSHYFGDKQGLINASMRAMLNTLRAKTEDYKQVATQDPIEKIKAIIDSNFDESQTNTKAMRVWFEFWAASMHIPELQRLQRINDQRLYSNLKHYFLQLIPSTAADIASRGLAVLIDGLWLRGSLMSHQGNFDTEKARLIAYNYLEMQIKKSI